MGSYLSLGVALEGVFAATAFRSALACEQM